MPNVLSYKKSELSVFANTIRALLTFFCTSENSTIIFSPKILFNLLRLEDPDFKKTKDYKLMGKIKSALEELIEHEEVHIIKKFKEAYIATSDSIWIDGNQDYFAKIPLEDMQRIFATSSRPFHLFDFYGKLLMSIGFHTKTYHLSQEQMADRWNLNEATVRNYIHDLEELDLIYVHRCQYRYPDTQQVIGHFYGRYKDKYVIAQTAEEYIRQIKAVPIREQTRKTNQSVRMRYNAFVKGAKKYQENPELIIHLYRECQAYNDSYSYCKKSNPELAEQFRYSLLDLSPFQPYLEKLGITKEHEDEKDVDRIME